jgi:hypothetical protein
MSTLNVGAIKNLSGQPLLNNVGSIIQVVYADMGSNTVTIAAQNNSVIPNCSVAITPTRASSKILLLAHIVHNAFYVSSFGFARNDVNIGGNNNTNSSNAISMNFEGQPTTDQGWTMASTYQYLDSPNTTDTTTYAATACSSWNGVIYTLRINDRTQLDMRGLSSIVAMEILA